MIVCVCKAVSDRQIRAAVADGATSMRDLRRELCIGTCCGKCVPEAKQALAQCLGAENSLVSRTESGVRTFFPRAAPEFAA